METLPSKQIVIADVPETEEFTATFQYNFFVPDESVNDTGSVPEKLLERAGENFDINFIESVEFKKYVSRAVRFNWRPKYVGNNLSDNVSVTGKGDSKYLAQQISIRKNLDKIHYEDDFASSDYASLHIQDTQLKEEMTFLTNVFSSDILSSFSGSLQDAAKELNKKTSEDIKGSILANAVNNLSRKQVFFSSASEEDGEVKTSMQVNKKLVSDLMETTFEGDSLNQINTETMAQLQNFYTMQSSAIKNTDSNFFDVGDYELKISKPLKTTKVDLNKYDPIMQTIGYIIEKYEVAKDGSIKTRAPIVVENPSSSTSVDVQVRYGARYFYNIRTVAYVEAVAVNEATSETVVIGFLLASKPLKSRIIECIEEVAPPPPADFTVAWGWGKRVPRLNWNFPVNPQRDIKYFQIFRRRTVYEPFQLIAMYDFDDSVLKHELGDNLVDDDLISKMSSPLGYYLDLDFDREGFIYAICCVDAHGFSSNYSMQLKAKFSESTNKLNISMVSVAGAPKPYPNAFLNVDTFVDTIKDEGHRKLTVVFNPEYLKVTDKQENDLKLLKTANGEMYRLQLTNIDLQQQANINISLSDKTKTQITKTSPKEAFWDKKNQQQNKIRAKLS